MRRIVTTIVASLTVLLCAAAPPVKTVEGEATYRAPKTMSLAEIEREAMKMAQINALEKAFGTFITESTTSIDSNIDSKGESYFASTAASDVKGEWLETIGKPEYETFIDGDFIIMSCKIKGKAREISSLNVDFEAAALRNTPDKRYGASEFNDGDDMFLYFKSPETGFLNVFLLDHTSQEAYCLLPYKRAGEGVYTIKADKEYILFSEKTAPEPDQPIVDEYTLSATDAKEYNEIVLVFSPKRFRKASLNVSDADTAPKSTSIREFNEWLAKVKSKDASITSRNIALTISKK